jgi:hypothetical protein
MIRPASGHLAGTGLLARTNRWKDTRTRGHPYAESQTKNTGTNLTNAPEGTSTQSQSLRLNGDTSAVPVQCLNATQPALCPLLRTRVLSSDSRRFAALCRKKTTKAATGHKGSSRVDKLGVTGSSPVPPISESPPFAGILLFRGPDDPASYSERFAYSINYNGGVMPSRKSAGSPAAPDRRLKQPFWRSGLRTPCLSGCLRATRRTSGSVPVRFGNVRRSRNVGS